MPTIGQTLRTERENRGWTIADVAAKTRIQAQYFEAIERDDTQSLPGGFFYRSFVRQYARLLELPESVYESVLESHLLDEQMAIAAQPTSLHERPLNVPPMPTGLTDPAAETRRWLLRLGGLALVILFCSFVYALSVNWKAWFGGMLPTTAPEPPVAQAPAEQTKPAPPPVQSSEPVETPLKGDSAAAENQPAAPATTVPQAAEQPAAQPQSPPPQQPPPQGAPAGGAVTLSIRATDVAWVQVRDSGKVVFSNIIPIGESRTFSGNERLRVLFGNAGGVEVIYNGKPMPPPGPKGQVRTLEFTREGFEVIVKPPALSAPAGKQ